MLGHCVDTVSACLKWQLKKNNREGGAIKNVNYFDSRQFKENYTHKNTDGVSINFLTLWLLGDILNLFGIIIDNLLFTMVRFFFLYIM